MNGVSSQDGTSDAETKPATAVQPQGDSPSDGPTTTAPAAEERPTRTLLVVARAIERCQTRALICEHLARTAISDFSGNETRPPRYSLKLPNAGAYAANKDDVVEIVTELYELASRARRKVATLIEAPVIIEPSQVEPEPENRGPFVPAPEGERVERNPPPTGYPFEDEPGAPRK